MYGYTLTSTLLDGASNIYLLSTATLFLAVAIALYFSNLLKEEIIGSEVVDNETDSDIEADDEGAIFDDQPDLEEILASSLLCSECGTNEIDNLPSLVEDTEDTGTQSDSGLVGKMKSKRVKQLEAQLTEDQLDEERRIEREQMAAIFELLKRQESNLNTSEIDEDELKAQLKLYR